MIRALVVLAAVLGAIQPSAGHAAPFKDCRMYWSESLPERPRKVDRAIEAASAELAKQQHEAARKLLQEELESASDDGKFWLYDAIGTSYAMEKRLPEAVDAFGRSAALTLNVRGEYEARRKLAFAQASADQHPAAIATLEQMQREVCAPLAGKLAHQLAASYLHEGKVEDADRALAPLRIDPGEAGMSKYLGLELRVQCANRQARACVERFISVQSRHELDVTDAAWFSRLIPAIAKSALADDLLAKAREKGWIDSGGQAVATATETSDKTIQLVPIKRPAPGYPRQALAAGITGWVDLAVTVAADGSIREVSVIESRPPSVFEKAAMEAVRRWKFQPKVVDGVAVESTGRQRIDFKLGRDD